MAKEFSGLTEAEAAIKACEALGLSRSQLKYSVVSRDEGPPRSVIIAVNETSHQAARVDEGERQPAHLASEYDRVHGRSGGQAQPQAARSERSGPDRHRRPGGGSGRDRGPRSSGGERRERADNEEFSDSLADEYKEFREMTAAPKEPVARKPAVDEAHLSERAKKALEVTSQLLHLASLEGDVQITVDNDEQVLVDIHGVDEGLIIGRKGEMLLALQFMVNRLVGKDSEGPERIAVDCEGYRERRQDALRVLALKLGEKAKSDGKPVTLSPMNAHDRRIFHITLDGQNGLKTRSEGDGLYRRVMIIPDSVG